MSVPSIGYYQTNGTIMDATYDYGTIPTGGSSAGASFNVWNLKGGAGSIATSVYLRVMDSNGVSQVSDLVSSGWMKMRVSTGGYTTMSSGATLMLGNISANQSVAVGHYITVPLGASSGARTWCYRADYSFA